MSLAGLFYWERFYLNRDVQIDASGELKTACIVFPDGLSTLSISTQLIINFLLFHPTL